MEHYAGINVSLEFSSACIVDAHGKIVKETKTTSEAAALVSLGSLYRRKARLAGIELCESILDEISQA